jgi:ABC-type sugar transport system permease subunit
VWVWLGRNSTSWGPGRVIIGGIFLAAGLALVYASVRTVRRSPSLAGLYVALTAIPLWVALRTFTDGIGGFEVTDAGEIRGAAVNFVQAPPFNNFFLMLILIWIQTGFAMVILSAAIKAVPEDFIEAAKIDGATDGQIFWRITVPSIAPTIGVVATTIMVNVMKVFDIVKVTTNGQFDSQVLANAMWEQAFLFSNRGVGAALAILIFVGIFPVMVFNIYRLTRQEA